MIPALINFGGRKAAISRSRGVEIDYERHMDTIIFNYEGFEDADSHVSTPCCFPLLVSLNKHLYLDTSNSCFTGYFYLLVQLYSVRECQKSGMMPWTRRGVTRARSPLLVSSLDRLYNSEMPALISVGIHEPFRVGVYEHFGQESLRVFRRRSTCAGVRRACRPCPRFLSFPMTYA